MSTPYFFGPDSARLFGWLHQPPASPAPQGAGLGLVICNPFGFEDVCAHRSLAQLAEQAAAAGVPALRFDLAGCGNSSGDAFDSATLARWIASVHHAAESLKQRTGVQRICLLGLRLGGTLATLAAMERDDVESLVTIAPVIQGRLYVRELRILCAAGASPDAQGSDSLLEAAGFLLTEETTQALSTVDLRKLARPPAKNILLVERDDMPTSTQWTQALSALGAQVHSEAWPGYSSMMADPQRTVVPTAMLAGIVHALAGWHAALQAQGPAQAMSDAGALAGGDAMEAPAFRETAIHIDTGVSRLFAVLTQAPPTRPVATTNKVGVLLINCGAVRHMGPNRLWVRLARRWAARGVTVLRLDLSGIGDSAPRPQAQPNVIYSAEAALDIAAALQYMQTQLGVHECHLLGLCSGAYHAFKAGVAGQPLKSVIMVNPLAFFWTLGMAPDDAIKDYELVSHSKKYRGQIFSLAPWRKLLSGKMDLGYISRFVARRLAVAVHQPLRRLAILAGIPVANDLGAELTQCVRQGVQQKFVFAEGSPGLELLRLQGGRRLNKLRAEHAISIDCIANADHTFTRTDARNRLVAVLDGLLFDQAR